MPEIGSRIITEHYIRLCQIDEFAGRISRYTGTKPDFDYDRVKRALEAERQFCIEEIQALTGGKPRA